MNQAVGEAHNGDQNHADKESIKPSFFITTLTCALRFHSLGFEEDQDGWRAVAPHVNLELLFNATLVTMGNHHRVTAL